MHIALMAAVQALGLLFIGTAGTQDVDTYWLQWISNINEHGLTQGYVASASDYPPVSFVWLAGVARISHLTGLSAHLTLKLALFVCLGILAAVCYAMTRDIRVTVAVQGGLVLNSMGLAYLDVPFLMILTPGLWLLTHEHPAAGLLLYSLSCLMKFQAAIIAPVVLYYLWRAGALNIRVLAPAGVATVGSMLWVGNEIVLALSRGADHQVLSGFALNFNWLLTYAFNLILRGTIAQVEMIAVPSVGTLPSKLIFGITYLIILYRGRWETVSDFLRTACMAYMAYFVFNAGVHENHLAMAIPLYGLLAATSDHERPNLLFVTLFANLNLVIFYGLDGQASLVTKLPYLDLVLAFVMVGWFGKLLQDYQTINAHKRVVAAKADPGTATDPPPPVTNEPSAG